MQYKFPESLNLNLRVQVIGVGVREYCTLELGQKIIHYFSKSGTFLVPEPFSLLYIYVINFHSIYEVIIWEIHVWPSSNVGVRGANISGQSKIHVYSPPSAYKVYPVPWITLRMLWSCGIYYWKQSMLKWTLQFNPVLVKCQLCIKNINKLTFSYQYSFSPRKLEIKNNKKSIRKKLFIIVSICRH